MKKYLLLAACVVVTQDTKAGELLPHVWNTDTITFQLGSFPGFETEFVLATEFWNRAPVNFTVATGSQQASGVCQSNGNNGVTYSETVCGQAWGETTLAVAINWHDQDFNAIKSDIIFNATKPWSGGPTPPAGGGFDPIAVATHEIGHVLGLAHSTDAQALMWPFISGVQAPQVDDVVTLNSRYGDPLLTRELDVEVTGSGRVDIRIADGGVVWQGGQYLGLDDTMMTCQAGTCVYGAQDGAALSMQARDENGSAFFGYFWGEGEELHTWMPLLLDSDRQVSAHFVDAPFASMDEHYDYIRVEWDPVPNATHYEVWRCTDESSTHSSVCSLVLQDSSTGNFVTGGNAGASYWIRLRACNASVCSEFTDPVEGRRRPVPTEMSAPSTTPGASSLLVNLNWSASAMNRYEVYRCTTLGLETCSLLHTTSELGFHDSTAEAGVLHYYRLRGCHTEFSEWYGCTTLTDPVAGYRYAAPEGNKLLELSVDGFESTSFNTLVLGDLNADGYDDWITSFPGAGEDESEWSAGELQVFSGLDGSMINRIVSDTFAEFVSPFSNLGDLDMDGVNDFSISTGLRAESGRLIGRYLVYSGATLEEISRFDGTAERRLDALHYAGDLDGDAVSDLIFRWSEPGYVNNYYTSGWDVRSGATGNILYEVDTESGHAFLVRALGDLNSDGYDDLIYAYEGVTSVLSGEDFSVLTAVQLSVNYFQDHSEVWLLGDINSDGMREFLVSDHFASPVQEREGRIVVVDGETGGELYAIDGTNKDGYLGIGLTRLQDIDADGHPDFAALERNRNSVDGWAGFVKVFSGATGQAVGAFRYEHAGWGDAPTAISLAQVSDLNNDGLRDMLASTRHGYQFTVYSFALEALPTLISTLVIPDSALRSCIQTHAASAGLEFVSQLGILDCSGAGIVSLEGLAALTALQSIDLRGNRLTSDSVRLLMDLQDENGLEAEFDWPAVATGDFNGDGKRDVLLRDPVAGSWMQQLMGEEGLLEAVALPLVSAPEWRLLSQGDFDGDGNSDLLFRHDATGAWYAYLMDGNEILDSGFMSMSRNLNWQFQLAGDFNGDLATDVLVRHGPTGRWYLYLLDGLFLPDGKAVALNRNTNWGVAAAGDFNGDNRLDVLLRHAPTNKSFVYLMDGHAVVDKGGLPLQRNANWTLQPATDLNQDGKDDLFMRHTTGAWYGYMLDGKAVPERGYMSLPRHTDWQLLAMGDFLASGHAGILLRNSAAGNWRLIGMEGRFARSNVAQPMPGRTSVLFSTTGDYDADGLVDVLLTDDELDRLYLYFSDGENLEAEPDSTGYSIQASEEVQH